MIAQRAFGGPAMSAGDRDFAIARAFDADGAAYLAPRRKASRRHGAVLPGFGLSQGHPLVYL